MTSSPTPHRRSSLTPSMRSGRCARIGLRLSIARRLVLEALYAADGPVAAAHLARTLSLDESSVYRNLELLEQRGIVRHLHLGHSPGLYALVSAHEVESLYCERCAKVTAVSRNASTPSASRSNASSDHAAVHPLRDRRHLPGLRRHERAPCRTAPSPSAAAHATACRGRGRASSQPRRVRALAPAHAPHTRHRLPVTGSATSGPSVLVVVSC